jgi:hypothetical protein
MSEMKLHFQPSKPYSTKGALSVFDSKDTLLHSDTLDLATNKKRKAFVKDVAEICEAIPVEKLEQAILEQIARILAEKRRADENTADNTEEAQPLAKSKAALAETDQQLVQLAEKLLRSPDLIEKIVDHVHKLGVAGEDELIVAVYIIGTSRLLVKPLAGLVMGQSSAGKSFIIDRVGRLFPDETVLRAHQISPKALQYLLPGSLVHRFVVAGERSRLQDDGAAEATRALRQMISDGRLSALVLPRWACRTFSTRTAHGISYCPPTNALPRPNRSSLKSQGQHLPPAIRTLLTVFWPCTMPRKGC